MWCEGSRCACAAAAAAAAAVRVWCARGIGRGVGYGRRAVCTLSHEGPGALELRRRGHSIVGQSVAAARQGRAGLSSSACFLHQEQQRQYQHTLRTHARFLAAKTGRGSSQAASQGGSSTSDEKEQQQQQGPNGDREQLQETLLAKLEHMAALKQQALLQSGGVPEGGSSAQVDLFDTLRQLVAHDFVTHASSTRADNVEQTLETLVQVLPSEDLRVLFHCVAFLQNLARHDVFPKGAADKALKEAMGTLKQRCEHASPLELVALTPEIVHVGDANHVALLAPIMTRKFAEEYPVEALGAAQQLATLFPKQQVLGQSISMMLEGVNVDELTLPQMAQLLQLHAAIHQRNRDLFAKVIRAMLSRESEPSVMRYLDEGLSALFKLRVPLDGHTKRMTLDCLSANATRDRRLAFTLLKFCHVNGIQPPSDALAKCVPHLQQLVSGNKSWFAAPYLASLANARAELPSDVMAKAEDVYAGNRNTPWPVLASFVFTLIISGKFEARHWPLVERVIVGYRQRADAKSTSRAFAILSWVFWQTQVPVPNRITQATSTCLQEMVSEQQSRRSVESQLQRDIAALLKEMNLFGRVQAEANVNGFLVDIFLPDEETIIEVDGLTHFVEIPQETASQRQWTCTPEQPLECIRQGAVSNLDPRHWPDTQFRATMRGSALVMNARSQLKRHLLQAMDYRVINLPFFVFRPSADKAELLHMALEDAGVIARA